MIMMTVTSVMVVNVKRRSLRIIVFQERFSELCFLITIGLRVFNRECKQADIDSEEKGKLKKPSVKEMLIKRL